MASSCAHGENGDPNPIMRAPPTSSNPDYFPKDSSPTSITLKVRASTHEYSGDTNMQPARGDLGKPRVSQKFIPEQSEATQGVCINDDLSLLCLVPTHIIASCSWESSIHAPFWLGWYKNTCSLWGAGLYTQVLAVWAHRVIPPPPWLGLCLLNGSPFHCHVPVMRLPHTPRFLTDLKQHWIICVRVSVLDIMCSGWPLCFSLPCQHQLHS